MIFSTNMGPQNTHFFFEWPVVDIEFDMPACRSAAAQRGLYDCTSLRYDDELLAGELLMNCTISEMFSITSVFNGTLNFFIVVACFCLNSNLFSSLYTALHLCTSYANILS
jgi:hypothetical protein